MPEKLNEENEYFIVANSCAAPFFSDTSTIYIKSQTPEEAMKKFIDSYSHPCGLYAANLYENADMYHKAAKPLIQYLSDKAKGAMEHYD